MGQNISCAKDIDNSTLSTCFQFNGMPLSTMLSKTKKSYSFANALLEATYETDKNLAKSDRLYILPPADEVIISNGEMVFKDTNVRKQIFIRKGLVGYEMHYFNISDCAAKSLRSFHNQTMYTFVLTKLSAILGGNDGSNLVSTKVKVYVGEPQAGENEDEPWITPVFIQFQNPENNFTKGIFPNDSDYNAGILWEPQDLKGIVDVVMAEDSITATDVNVSITGACDGEEIDEPLVTADFLVTKDSDGSTVAVTVTNVGNVYTIDGLTTATIYNITLKNQPDMTTKGYEAQGTLQVTTA